MAEKVAESWALGAVVLLLLLLVAVSAFLAWRERDRFALNRTREICSSVDGLPYRVHLVHGNPPRAADTMAELNRRAVGLMRHLRAKYLRGPTRGAFPEREHATARLLERYNPDNLAENSPRAPEGDTSYTVGKGATLALCLREKGPARAHGFHDLETLTFVTLHELTHIAIEDHDHPPRFWRAFRFLLEEAVQAGILQGVDYGRRPAVYCGLGIDYSPLHDPSLAPIT